MSKPLGLTPTLRIVRPTHVQNAIFDAVSEAFDAGMSVEEFRRESRNCWRIKARERAEEDEKAWRAR